MATWGYWNSSSTSSTTTSTLDPWYDWSGTTPTSSTTDTTWGSWLTGTTSSGTSATTDTWYQWDSQQEQMLRDHASMYAKDQLEAQRQMWQENQYYAKYIEPYDFILEHYKDTQIKINNEWRKHIAEQLRLEKKAAEETAKELLLDLVSEKEFELYNKTGKLLVKGRKHSYILDINGAVTTILNKKKKTAKGMCVHLNYTDKMKCPATDNVIALKVHIEQEEKKFLKTANHHGERILFPLEDEFLEAVNG